MSVAESASTCRVPDPQPPDTVHKPMRALRFDRYGPADVLRVETLDEPVPGAGEAKVRVRAVALNPLDWKIRAGHVRFVPLFKSPPRGTGCDFAGEIAAVGGGATERHVGERVFGSLLPFGREGALSEFIVVAYERMLPLPVTLDDVHAAALPIAGGTALQGLTDEAHVAAGARVLITGAAGGVGHFAVQIAKHLGAHVTGVASGRNADFVKGLGADDVIDYANEEFTARDERFDVVFDAAGVSTFGRSQRVLAESGWYINTCGDAAGTLGTLVSAVFARVATKQHAVALRLDNSPAMWRRLLDLAASGTIRAHVEKTISLDEVVAAQRAMESGHGRGKIVVAL